MAPATRHALAPVISEQLRIASDGFAVGHIRTMDEVMGLSTARQSFQMLLLTIFGAVALLLASIGIYSLLAYLVARRTQVASRWRWARIGSRFSGWSSGKV